MRTRRCIVMAVFLFFAAAFVCGKGIDAEAASRYTIYVNRRTNLINVVESGSGRLVRAMYCSTGRGYSTIGGTYNTVSKMRWHALYGGVYGQYCTRIHGSYLFHSVPYYRTVKNQMATKEYNKLGTQASAGCIRLAVVDAKWIYDNCDIGTRVIIYDDAEDPGPMGKPGTIYTDPADETLRGWDPTDPDPENPWDDKYLSGTTIRSEAAWDEWNAAQEDGRWNTSLTPTDLQGWSTDSSVEGTRG